MNSHFGGPRPSRCGVRIRGFGIHLPGPQISLADVDVSDDIRQRLRPTGQEFTYRAEGSSTDLAVSAARKALDSAGSKATDIGLVISAPTLLTGYGFEIPAVAVRAELGLENADCLNISHGCVGALAALRLAAQFLHCEPDRGEVLVVTACRASSLVDGFTHGAFSWGDGAGAMIVTADTGPGLNVEYYAEQSSLADWGAMRIPYGDARDYSDWRPDQDFRINVDFPDHKAQIEYVMREKDRCGDLIDALTSAAGIDVVDVGAVFLPSFGKNRVPLLLERHQLLTERVSSDFRFAHMGGVDLLLFLETYLKQSPPDVSTWLLALTPAFTAQWGGVAFRYVPTGP